MPLDFGEKVDRRERCGQRTEDRQPIDTVYVGTTLQQGVTVPGVAPGHWSFTGPSSSPLPPTWYWPLENISTQDSKLVNPRTVIDVYAPATVPGHRMED